jgi:hypothetical protein
MSNDIFLWWQLLCVVSVLNIVAWALSAVTLQKRAPLLADDIYALRRMQLLLSAVYVFGCAFRSVMPVYDVPRVCLFDTWMGSVMVGRTVATLAELCFAAQWALLLREFSHASDFSFGKTAALTLVPLIIVAETCSWYSVLTTSNLGHVAEESLWGFCATLLVASFAAMLPRADISMRPILLAGCIAGSIYAAFMFLVDVPMYWSRWVSDQDAGRLYLSVSQGFRDVSERWIVSHRWEIWRSELVWMSLYFSVGVWVSISLVRTPILQLRSAATNWRQTAPLIYRADA